MSFRKKNIKNMGNMLYYYVNKNIKCDTTYCCHVVGALQHVDITGHQLQQPKSSLSP